MTLLIDDALATALVSMPLREGWVEPSVPFEVRSRLRAADVGADDLALLPVAEATLLAGSHVVIPEFALIFDGVGDIAMRTPVRPDAIEAVPVRLLDTGGTAELLIRALLRPYFGITASTFVRDESDPAAAEAQVIVVEGLSALTEPEAGFQEDLVRCWFILTGSRLPGRVLVAGLTRVHQGIAAEVALLQAAVEAGIERRREVRIQLAGESGVDRERLAKVTNRLCFAFDQEDRVAMRNLIDRGTWGGPYPRAMPVFRDEVLSGEP